MTTPEPQTELQAAVTLIKRLKRDLNYVCWSEGPTPESYRTVCLNAECECEEFLKEWGHTGTAPTT